MGFIARLTDYIAGSVPRIKAADLNGIQDAIIELILGMITLKKLQVDGTGNAASSVGNGEISASGALNTGASDSGAAAPTPSVTAGRVSKGRIAHGWAAVGSAGTLVRGMNVLSTARPATGHYVIRFNDQLVDNNGTAPWVLPASSGIVPYGATSLVGGKLQLDLFFETTGGTPVNCDFSAGVFGE